MKLNRVIISGGGTGGHIFPAIAIANCIRKVSPQAEILFIGAEGKMEMEKVPAAGYKIVGLPIRGFQRKFDWSNFLLPFRIIASLWKARKLIKQFKPDAVIGVGGYASGPTLQMAAGLNIPCFIQEQNSFAGKTNTILGKKVKLVCVAYDGMQKFFPKERIVFTGNPVRRDMVDIVNKYDEAHEFFKTRPSKKTILVVGGSLGARTLNEAVLANCEAIEKKGYQVIWQCGKTAFEQMKSQFDAHRHSHIHLYEFIYRMDLAYAAADVVISRAGAIAVSELCVVGKPCVLVPSPYVAEDHQTKNAMALVAKDAALMVKDKDAQEELFPKVFELLQNTAAMEKLGANCAQLGIPDADERIVNAILNTF